MADDKGTIRDVDFRRLCPWLGLFRAFGIAVDIRKLVLATGGVLLTWLGWLTLASAFAKLSDDDIVHVQAGVVSRVPWDPGRGGAIDTRGVLGSLRRDPLPVLWQLATDWRFVMRPVDDLVEGFRGVLSPAAGFVPAAFSLAYAVWAAIVWAVFGGAITRIAAVQFAREEKIGLVESLKFSVSKFFSYAGAPVIPLLFVAILAVLCGLGGVISRIPGIGPLFAGALWFLPLIAGALMALLVIAWAAGWPLMFGTISVEGSDSFDALSRSWAYAFQRPWHFLFYILLAGTYGSICVFFVMLFGDLTVQLARWSVDWGAKSELLDQLHSQAPQASWRASTADIGDATTAVRFGAILVGYWLHLVYLLIVGFGYSYFWSASTIIYYLLRRDVDSTELDEVYIEGDEDDPGLTGDPNSPAAGASAANPTTASSGSTEPS